MKYILKISNRVKLQNLSLNEKETVNMQEVTIVEALCSLKGVTRLIGLELSLDRSTKKGVKLMELINILNSYINKRIKILIKLQIKSIMHSVKQLDRLLHF